MHEYGKDDFKDLLFPVYKVSKEGELSKLFPRLKEYPEFAEETTVSKLKIFKYICYAYDRKSPLMDLEDLNVRKREAALLAGFDRDEKGFKEDFLRIMMCGDKEVNAMIVRFCRMQSPMKFSHLISKTEAYYSMMAEIIYKSDETDPKKRLAIEAKRMELSTKSDEVINKIDELSRDILASDPNSDLDLTLFEVIDDETKPNPMISPEQITEDEAFV